MRFDISRLLVKYLIEFYSKVLDTLDTLIEEAETKDKAELLIDLHNSTLYELEDLDKHLELFEAMENYGCTGTSYNLDRAHISHLQLLTELPEEVIERL